MVTGRRLNALALMSGLALAQVSCIAKSITDPSAFGRASSQESAAQLAARKIPFIVTFPPRVLTTDGLPAHCFHFQNSSGETCINCKPNGVVISRCFQPQEAYVPTRQCAYTPIELTCSHADGRPMVSISFRNNHQELFQQNVPIILDTVRTIAESQLELQKPTTVTLLATLNFVRRNTSHILSGAGQQKIASDLKRSLETSGVKPSADQWARLEASLNTWLETIQIKRRYGTLTEEDGVNLARSLVRELPDNQRLLEILTTINLEGFGGPEDLSPLMLH